MRETTWIAVFLVACLYAEGASHPCQRPCVAGEQMTCRYHFKLEWYRTLSKACFDCPFNITDCYRQECIAGDGYVRVVIAVNRQVPGPAIEVCEGDTVVVKVTNMLEDGQTTSIHWHGQHVFKEPYFDGVGQITQCSIQHQETFVYTFTAGPAGTHFYHAHTGLQVLDGCFGPLIVHQSTGHDPNDNLYDHDLPQHVMMVYDWKPDLGIVYQINHKHVYDRTLDQTVMVNGRARKYPVGNPYGLVDTNETHAYTPLEVLHVKKGMKYRLRFISSAPVCPLQISVDQHQLMVISADGIPVKPRVLDAFIIHPGERYDFVLFADQDVDNYWLRAIGLWECEPPKANGKAIVRYEGAPHQDPSGDPNSQRDGILLNPILFDFNVPMYGFNRTVILTDDLRHAQDTNLTDQQVDVKFYIGGDLIRGDNTRYNNKQLYPVDSLSPVLSLVNPVLDNITFVAPPVPLLSEREDFNQSWFCNRSTIQDHDYCFQEDLCMCTHTLDVPLNKVVEIVLFYEGRLFPETGHTFHLHGHSYHLMGLGKVGTRLSRDEIEALDAAGELRRNYVSPSLRDTVNLPDGGYAILRFTANNPGYWLFHCHTTTHLLQGMALLFRVGETSDLPPVPDQFPRCGAMGYSNARRTASPPQPCSTDTAPALALLPRLHIAMVALAVVVLA